MGDDIETSDGVETEHLLKTAPISDAGGEAAEVAPKDLTCTRCGQTVRVGELVCPNCGLAMVTSNETHRIDEAQVTVPKGPQQTGEAISSQEKPITFELEGAVLNFSIQETLIVGRCAPNESAPDVDLSPYGAETHGVSRRHLQLKRRGDLIYITDLNSTNRTYLNGRRLIPGGDRLLRSGDEIQLGRLKIRVRF